VSITYYILSRRASCGPRSKEEPEGDNAEALIQAVTGAATDEDGLDAQEAQLVIEGEFAQTHFH
jgi:hypothetical protein